MEAKHETAFCKLKMDTFYSLFPSLLSPPPTTTTMFCPPLSLSLCLPLTPLLYIDFCIADVPEPCSSGGAAEESQPKFGLPDTERPGERKQQTGCAPQEGRQS